MYERLERVVGSPRQIEMRYKLYRGGPQEVEFRQVIDLSSEGTDQDLEEGQLVYQGFRTGTILAIEAWAEGFLLRNEEGITFFVAKNRIQQGTIYKARGHSLVVMTEKGDSSKWELVSEQVWQAILARQNGLLELGRVDYPIQWEEGCSYRVEHQEQPQQWLTIRYCGLFQAEHIVEVVNSNIAGILCRKSCMLRELLDQLQSTGVFLAQMKVVRLEGASRALSKAKKKHLLSQISQEHIKGTQQWAPMASVLDSNFIWNGSPFLIRKKESLLRIEVDLDIPSSIGTSVAQDQWIYLLYEDNCLFQDYVSVLNHIVKNSAASFKKIYPVKTDDKQSSLFYAANSLNEALKSCWSESKASMLGQDTVNSIFDCMTQDFRRKLRCYEWYVQNSTSQQMLQLLAALFPECEVSLCQVDEWTFLNATHY